MLGKDETCANCNYSVYNPKTGTWVCRFHWLTIKGPDGQFVQACLNHIPREEEPY